MSKFQNLKDLIEKNHQWPCHYTFKFIIPSEKESEIRTMLELDITIVQYEFKASGGGKYLSLTFSQHFESTHGVIAVYEKVTTIKGVISL